MAATSTPIEPLLFVDLYSGDCGGKPSWRELVADPRYVGAILKATEGEVFPTRWFAAEWPALRAAAGARYGASFFRGAYHYLCFGDDPARQAAFYLATVEAAGGWADGDLVPIVDVERGSERASNHRASAQQVVDVTSRFVDAVKQATGQRVMIYGRGAMRDLGITSRCGADLLWNPGYTSHMPPADAIGWPDELVALWQYTDGTALAAELPRHAPGLGAVDASVFRGGGLDALRATLVATPRAP